MSISLYMDEHVHRAITDGLRLRGVDVLTIAKAGNPEDLANRVEYLPL